MKSKEESLQSVIMESLIKSCTVFVDTIPPHFTHYICRVQLKNTHMTQIDNSDTILDYRRLTFTFYENAAHEHCIFVASKRQWHKIPRWWTRPFYLIRTCTVNVCNLYAFDNSQGPVAEFCYGVTKICGSENHHQVRIDLKSAAEKVVCIPDSAIVSYISGMDEEYYATEQLDPNVVYRNDLAEMVIKRYSGPDNWKAEQGL